jgi:S1-C subfamily serine protease
VTFTLAQDSDDDAYYAYYEDQAAQALQNLQSQLKKNGAGDKPVRTPTTGFANETAHNKLGVKVQELNDQLKVYFGVTAGGILVTSVTSGSAGDTAGFKAGDCITEVNGDAIASIQAFNKELKKNGAGQLNITVIRSGQPMVLQATIDASK